MKKDAQGNFNDLFIVSSPEDKEYIKPVIDELFSKIIHTPTEEFEINIIWKNAWELDDIRNQYNILVLALDNPIDSTGDVLVQKFKPQDKQTLELFLIEDIYANNQQTIIVHATDAIHFNEIINENKKWLLSNLNNSIDNQLLQYVYEQGQNNSLSEKISKKFNITFEVQEDFKILRENVDHFLWIGRGYPYRWITLHREKKNLFKSPENSWTNLDSIFNTTLPEVAISKFYKEYEFIELQSKKVKLLRGLYEHHESESGGPFFVYIFELNESDEVILVSGFVNYPGHDKYLLLRQLEVMIKTALVRK